MFFCECIFVKNVWVQLFKLLKTKCNLNVDIQNGLLLFGSPTDTLEGEIITLCLLIVKFYIHKCRSKKKLPKLKASIGHILFYKKNPKTRDDVSSNVLSEEGFQGCIKMGHH